jgi:hypothetical protein
VDQLVTVATALVALGLFLALYWQLGRRSDAQPTTGEQARWIAAIIAIAALVVVAGLITR